MSKFIRDTCKPCEPVWKASFRDDKSVMLCECGNQDMYGDHPSPPSHRSDERGAAARIILLLYGSLLWKRFRLGSSVTLHVFQDPFHSPKFFSLSRWVMRKMAMVRETVIADLTVGQ